MSWMQTYTGKKFYVTEPEKTDFDLEDIAHALSHLCRFGGHTKFFYSVAQHSILVADIVASMPDTTVEDELWALMHDATEAYLIDVPTPIKVLLDDYKPMELKVQNAIEASLGLPKLPDGQLPKCIKDADRIALITEALQLINGTITDWKAYGECSPFPCTILPLRPQVVRKAFLARWKSIQRRLRQASA